MNCNRTIFLATVATVLAFPATAEISGSGWPNANCGAAMVGGTLYRDVEGEPGIASVTLHLDGEERSLAATSDDSGRYEFNGLCEGDYELSIDFDTVPEGLELIAARIQGDDDDDDDDDFEDRASTSDNGWEIEVDVDDRLDHIDFVFAGEPVAACTLTMTAGCAIASLPSELYTCSKPVNRMTMTWRGDTSVRVVAHNGNDGDPVLADIDFVAPGDSVSVGPIDDPKDDLTWVIYAAGTSARLGESRFHMACDDEEMDGPEDCATLQGNGKDNKSSRINSWQLASLTDASGQLDCAAARAYTQNCTFDPVRADCDMLDEVHALSFVYTGAGCEASSHDQPDKAKCEGEIANGEAATVELEDGTVFVVQPGEAFSIPPNGSDTKIELVNSGGKQKIELHNSCSKPLAVGDVFGALRLEAINGLGIGTPVDFAYAVGNASDDAVTVSIDESTPTLFDVQHEVDGGGTATLYGSRWISASVTNEVTATESEGCAATSVATATVLPLATCDVTETSRELHDAEMRWRLVAGSSATATVERVEVSWPDEIAGKLKEMKFDGDKFFDRDIDAGPFVVSGDDLEGEIKKRRIGRGKERELKIKFDDHIDEEPGDYRVTVHFAEGCSITW